MSEITWEDLRDLGSYWSTRTFLVSVRLGVYDALAGGPLTAHEVARECALDPHGAEVLLDALVALRVLEREGERYGNTRVAQQKLVESSPLYAGHTFLLADRNWELWGRAAEAVRTGRPVRTRSIFHEDPEGARLLLRALHAEALEIAPGIVETLGAPLEGTLLDIGGGAGSWSVAFCRLHSELRAILFDLPVAIDVARDVVKEYGLGRRIELVPGDYQADDLPAPVDAAWLSQVVHSLSPEEVRALFEKVRASVRGGGKVFVRDFFLDEDRTGPPRAAVFSMNMLLGTGGGRSYTAREIGDLLREAGFPKVREVVPGAILEAR